MMGAIGSLFGGGKKSQSVQSTQKSEPSDVIKPYLNGQTGIYPEAQRLYQNQGYTQQQRDLNNAQFDNLNNRNGQIQTANSLGHQALHGVYDANVQRVGNIQGAPDIYSQSVNPTQAFRSFGAADPTSALSSLLSGKVNTSTLDPVVNNALTRISDNFNEHVLPGINQGAIASGQYGGSRQGIAQGLALKGLSQTLGDTAAGLYNNAYQTAQQNQYGTANNLSGLSISNAQQNANRDLQAQTANAANQLSTQQFNANLGLQNNNQALQQSAQQLANRQQGLNLFGQGNQLQDQIYNQQSGLLNAENDFNANNLARYASIIQPGAGIGGTTTSTSNGGAGTNPFASALGGGIAGAQFASLVPSLGISQGLGAGLGALLLSDRSTKTDIEKVGKLDNGLNVYRYRYKTGGPMMLGVMADEVKSVKPSAVTNIGGLDHVNYGAL